jgi:hypothetical protein
VKTTAQNSLEASLEAELAALEAEEPPDLAATLADLEATELKLLEIEEAAETALLDALTAEAL